MSEIKGVSYFLDDDICLRLMKPLYAENLAVTPSCCKAREGGGTVAGQCPGQYNTAAIGGRELAPAVVEAIRRGFVPDPEVRRILQNWPFIVLRCF